MKTQPRKHQNDTFEASKDLPAYALWWEMGLGKSKELIDTMCHLFLSKKIDAMLVVAPNGVHGNIVSQEIPKHTWDEVSTSCYVFDTGKSARKKDLKLLDDLMSYRGCAVLVMSYDGFKSKQGYQVAIEFLQKRRCLWALDESTAIADPDSERSKKITSLSQLAPYRRVMSGTPVAEGPFKIFNQVRFLDAAFWQRHGMKSFFAFKNTFAAFERTTAKQGHQYQKLIEYRNLEYLNELIAPISSRYLKEDVLDLPPKIYMTVEFDMSSAQEKMYADLRDRQRAEIAEGSYVETAMALVKMTRLQQITSGFAVTEEMPPMAVGDTVVWRSPELGERHGEITEVVPPEGPNKVMVVLRTVDAAGDVRLDGVKAEDFGTIVRLVATNQKIVDLFPDQVNPRVNALLQTIAPLTHKVIVWARFTRDIDAIVRALEKEYGPGSCARYDGTVKQSLREGMLASFRDDPNCRFFVANPAAISMGVTLVQAKTVIYYSNDFRLERRLQSEDRAHRIGQDVAVTIVDLVARGTVDEYIAETLQEKFDLAAKIMGDPQRPWLR